MSHTSPNIQRIDWFLSHGVERIFPSRDALEERLRQGERLTIYHGIDPTGVLHLGHTIPLRKLAELQAMGHKIILLIGDFTAMIGDPTDKMATRKALTREQVLENCRLYKEQISFLIRFDGPNPAEMRFNSEWLQKMSFSDVVELASHFTVQQMMERDMFEKRWEEEKPIYVHEFLYPLMQGYDSVALNVDMELGGNDQTFNMLAGRTLLKELKGKEKYVMTLRLLADASGKKMGKTEGNFVPLTDRAEEIYGKIMSWTDGMIFSGFELCTDASSEEVAALRARMGAGENPIGFKRDLAWRITAFLRSKKEADRAAEQFAKVHQQHEMPDEIRVVHVDGAEVALVDVLVQSELVSSNTDARRQIEQGGVKVGEQIEMNPKRVIAVPEEGVIIQKGKRHFVRLMRT